jgi:hypothetical protein
MSNMKEKEHNKYILDGLQVHVVIQMKVVQILDRMISDSPEYM